MTRTPRVGREPDRPDGRPTRRTAGRRRSERERPARTLFPRKAHAARPCRFAARRPAARRAPQAVRGDAPRTRRTPHLETARPTAPAEDGHAGTSAARRTASRPQPGRAARSGAIGNGPRGATASGRRADGQRAGDGPPRGANRGPPPRGAPDRGGRADRARRGCPAGRCGRVRSTKGRRGPRGHGSPGSPDAGRERSRSRERRAGGTGARAGGADRALRAERPSFPGAHAGGQHSRPARGPARRAGRGRAPTLVGPAPAGERASRLASGARGSRALRPQPRRQSFRSGRLFSFSLNSSASGSGSFFSEMFGHVLE